MAGGKINALERRIGLSSDGTRAPTQGPEWPGRLRSPHSDPTRRFITYCRRKMVLTTGTTFPVTPIAKTTDASAPLGDPDDFTEQPRPKRVISKNARRAERIRVEPIAPIAKATEASAAGPLENIERISVTWVPSSYYQKLGLTPIIGRLLTKDDDAPLVGVITDRYWEVCLGRDPKVIGQSLRIEDTAVTIVGVIPFKTPTSAKSLMADLTMAIGTRSKVTLGGGTFKLGSNFRIINVILPMRV